MRAVDTNLVVRLLTRDDEDQFQAAKRLFGEGNVFVGSTVILECEWVLRSGYKYGSNKIVQTLTELAGLPEVTLEEPLAVAQALKWLDSGMDFADALHLARSQHCEAFVSFDRTLARRASKLATIPVHHP